MTEERQSLGRWGEEQASRFLRRKGMKILDRNMRTPVGEIDIVARLGKTLVFVEVKTRSSDAFGSPQEAVGPAKQRQILRTAQWYLGAGKGRGLQPRFDVVAVRPGQGGAASIEHIEDAFGA
ncbi:YraN family protein [uncultured Desulfuromonas sp.]|uniref:YraN family protein n=1 Tax=uncultured Desulfuromonas sp. TaxID=181013 RepID=UPI00260BF211|nr:YraN family protein [uncultured Desulfuromonas sp.]